MKRWSLLIVIAVLFVASGCGGNANNNAHDAHADVHNNHGDMNHSSSGEIPEGLQQSGNPTFPAGSNAVIQADHMEGMNGAVATIVGAYDTTVYAVSYTPVSGGEQVNNHKWVVHQEIKDAGVSPFAPGGKVVLQADHMKGMEGATATIDSAEQTTVYMVDYNSTADGEFVQNHKWVTESELVQP